MDRVRRWWGRDGAHNLAREGNSLMKWKAINALALATVLASTGTVVAEANLKVGDRAPKLQTGKWIQGEPIKNFENGKAYIVEFWATWCGPCRVSIPHLNETYTKFNDKGLLVIGQDCWERDDSLVAPFVKKMGEKMTYRVALDDKSSDEKGTMARTWMEAADQTGIPTAFLIDPKGMIAWIGHPMELKDSIIEEVLGGKFDLAKAAAESEDKAKLKAALSEVTAAMENKDWDA